MEYKVVGKVESEVWEKVKGEIIGKINKLESLMRGIFYCLKCRQESNWNMYEGVYVAFDNEWDDYNLCINCYEVKEEKEIEEKMRKWDVYKELLEGDK